MNQNKKMYLITYSADMSFNNHLVRERMNYLLNVGYITDWWYYVDNTYLVICTLDANTLCNEIYPYVNRNCLIVEVKPENAQGWLPMDAWNWINKYRERNNKK